MSWGELRGEGGEWEARAYVNPLCPPGPLCSLNFIFLTRLSPRTSLDTRLLKSSVLHPPTMFHFFPGSLHQLMLPRARWCDSPAPRVPLWTLKGQFLFWDDSPCHVTRSAKVVARKSKVHTHWQMRGRHRAGAECASHRCHPQEQPRQTPWAAVNTEVPSAWPFPLLPKVVTSPTPTLYWSPCPLPFHPETSETRESGLSRSLFFGSRQ